MCIRDRNNYHEHLSKIIEDKIEGNYIRGMWIIISHYISEELQKVIAAAKGEGIKIKWIIPKKEGTDIMLNNHEDIFVWEVM